MTTSFADTLEDTLTPCMQEPELWYADSPLDFGQAREACSWCPLVRECAQAAIDGGESWGVWATVRLVPNEFLGQKRDKLKAIANGGPLPTFTATAPPKTRRPRRMDAPEKLRAQAEALCDAGLSISRICCELDLSQWQVGKLLRGYPRPQRSSWTDARVSIADTMLTNGATFTEVGRALGLSASAVSQRFRGRATVKSLPFSKWPPERKQKAIDLLDSGMPYHRVAAEVGSTHETLAKHLPGYFQAPGRAS